MKIVLSNSPGSFTIKPKVKYWMILNGGEELFVKYPLDKSHFNKKVVLNAALYQQAVYVDYDVQHGGMFDDKWGKFNTHLVDTKEGCFCEIPFEVKIGRGGRDHETFVKAVKKFDLEDFRLIDVENKNFQIKKDYRGEFLD